MAGAKRALIQLLGAGALRRAGSAPRQEVGERADLLCTAAFRRALEAPPGLAEIAPDQNGAVGEP